MGPCHQRRRSCGTKHRGQLAAPRRVTLSLCRGDTSPVNLAICGPTLSAVRRAQTPRLATSTQNPAHGGRDHSPGWLPFGRTDEGILVKGRPESPVVGRPMIPAVSGAAPLSGEVRSLVLRAWLEPGFPHLRVRLVEIPSGHGERPVATATSIDETCRAVRTWLEALQAGGDNGSCDGAVTPKK